MEKELLKEMCKELNEREDVIELEIKILEDRGYNKKSAVAMIKKFYRSGVISV